MRISLIAIIAALALSETNAIQISNQEMIQAAKVWRKNQANLFGEEKGSSVDETTVADALLTASAEN